MDKCVHCGFCLPTCPSYLLLGQEMDSPRGRIYMMKAGVDGRVAMTRRHGRALRHVPRLHGVRNRVPVRRALRAAHRRNARRDRASPSTVRRATHFSVACCFGSCRIPRGCGCWRCRSRSSTLLRRVPACLRFLPADCAIWSRSRRTRPRSTTRNSRTHAGVGPVADCASASSRDACSGIFRPRQRGHRSHARRRRAARCWRPPRRGAAARWRCTQAGEDGKRAGSRKQLIASFEDATAGAGVDEIVDQRGGLRIDDEAIRRAVQRRSVVGRARSRVRVEGSRRHRNARPRSSLARRGTGSTCASRTTTPAILRTPRACGASRATLLAAIPGVTIVPIAESDICCGSAGIFNLVQPEMAAELGRRKAANIAEARAGRRGHVQPWLHPADSGCSPRVRRARHAGCPHRPIAGRVNTRDEGVSGPIARRGLCPAAPDAPARYVPQAREPDRHAGEPAGPPHSPPRPKCRRCPSRRWTAHPT